MREAEEPEEVEQGDLKEVEEEEQVDVRDRQLVEIEVVAKQVDVGDRQLVEVEVVAKQVVGVPEGEWLHSLLNVAQTYCF